VAVAVSSGRPLRSTAAPAELKELFGLFVGDGDGEAREPVEGLEGGARQGVAVIGRTARAADEEAKVRTAEDKEERGDGEKEKEEQSEGRERVVVNLGDSEFAVSRAGAVEEGRTAVEGPGTEIAEDDLGADSSAFCSASVAGRGCF